MVANTSELLPEPDTPVKTVSRRFGRSTETFLRLFSRAPSTLIRAWSSAGCVVMALRLPCLLARRAGPPGGCRPSCQYDVPAGRDVTDRLSGGAAGRDR